MKSKTLIIVAVLALTVGFCQTAQARKRHTANLVQAQSTFVVATEHGVAADGKTDVTGSIQKLITDHPNKTIVFPDGVYLVSRPIDTPAEPTKSVSLVLGNYAIFKAAGNWTEGQAILRLGAIEKANNICVNGSNYGVSGGIFDGSGIADGISIDGGRETKVESVSIKNTRVGLHVKYGANSGSSDADITDVNIVGNGKANAIGVLVEGFDNTFTNMRIADVQTGVALKSGGNSLRNIHPLYIFRDTQVYGTSCGFVITDSNNFLNYCYSDQFATGFKISRQRQANLTDCFCFWYSGKVAEQTAIECEGPLESMVTGLKVGFSDACPKLTILKAEKGGNGKITNFIMPGNKFTDSDVAKDYMR